MYVQPALNIVTPLQILLNGGEIGWTTVTTEQRHRS